MHQLSPLNEAELANDSHRGCDKTDKKIKGGGGGGTRNKTKSCICGPIIQKLEITIEADPTVIDLYQSVELCLDLILRVHQPTVTVTAAHSNRYLAVETRRNKPQVWCMSQVLASCIKTSRVSFYDLIKNTVSKSSCSNFPMLIKYV